LFLGLPTWDDFGNRRGEFEFRRSGGQVPATTVEAKEGWRAVLESLGYVVRALYPSGMRENTLVATSGGGTVSRVWMQILADVIGCTLSVPIHSSGAAGAVQLAVRSLGVNPPPSDRGADTVNYAPRESSVALEDNRKRTATWYQSRAAG
jgi:sugar (pentulose or hexulose) kinase